MRILSALLCFCLSFNVMAASGSLQEFEKTLDEYHYSMTVEWDQVDPAFMQSKTEEFFDSMAALMDKGMTSEEILRLVAAKTKNPKELEAIKLKMSILAKNSEDTSELAVLISENSNEFYSTGANWSGYIYAIGLGVIVAAVIGYSIWWDSKHTCVARAQGTQCGWTSYYYGGPQFYQCWNTTYCTQYVKN